MKFNYLPIRAVYYGPNSIVNISDIIQENKLKKVLVVTNNSVSKTVFYKRILSEIDAEYIEFKEITQHSPMEEIEHGTEMYRNFRCDSVISIGGGSVIDSSKLIRYYFDSTAVQIAIPTTLSAAEFSHIAGFTIGGEKQGVRDKIITPQYVILDPDAAAETPKTLWQSSGIRSLDHAVETIISNSSSEIATFLALEAIEKLTKYLHVNTTTARMECQKAAWYSYFQVYDASMGLSHNIGKIIGAKWDIPHGITSCITLPKVAKYYAETEPDKMALIAKHLGYKQETIEDMAMKAAETIEVFIKVLELERKLSDFGISENDLDYIVSKLDLKKAELKGLLASML